MKINSLILKCCAFFFVVCLIGNPLVQSRINNSNGLSDKENRSRQTSPCSSIQLIITDDGSGDPTDKKVDVPPYIPNSGETPVLNIYFTILGATPDGIRHYYGDDPWEDRNNITISGDILYPVNQTTLIHIVDGDWVTSVTPTKPRGTIILQIDWPGNDNGSANQTLDIINGVNAVSTPKTYYFGQDTSFVITVTDEDGVVAKYAQLYLLWEENNSQFNSTIGDNTADNGKDGEYRFTIRSHEHGYFPQHITIAAQLYPTLLYWGYTKVDPIVAEPKLNLSVKGGIGIIVFIKNEGQAELRNINTTIDFDAGIYLWPKGGYSIHPWGSLPTDLEMDWRVPVFGIGTTVLTVKASGGDALITLVMKNALVLGPFVFLK
jgi:hypothetical protein